MSDQIDYDQVMIRRLGKNTPGISTFKNQKQAMVDHLQRDELNEQKQKIGTTWVWVYNDCIVLGYITLAAYSMNKKYVQSNQDYMRSERFPYGTIPALLIGQLATHEEYEHQGVGKRMIAWAIRKAIELSKVAGCRMVALHSYDDVVDWYEKQKFRKVSAKRTIMYLDIKNQ